MLLRYLLQGSRGSGFLGCKPLPLNTYHARAHTASPAVCWQARPKRAGQSAAAPQQAAVDGPRQGGPRRPHVPNYQRKAVSLGKRAGKQRLNKALAAAGIASRRAADAMVLEGRVTVNGEPAEGPWQEVDLASDHVLVDGKRVSAGLAARKYYFAVNKPKGYICSSAGAEGGGSGERRVIDLFADWQRQWRQRQPQGAIPPRLYTVGRLDVASVGLILVTNDGDWAQKVMHPSSNITKEYSVTLNRRPTKTQLDAIAAGCTVDGVTVVPVAVAVDDTDLSTRNRVRVVVSEGRNREVRNLVSNAGLEVTTLRRLRVGGYRMPRNLGIGEFRELKPLETRRILDVGADRSA